VDREVPRLGCVKCDDSLVVKVHVLVVEPNREKSIGSPKKFDERLDSVDCATGYLDFEGLAFVFDEDFNIVDWDFSGDLE
jgi:hypothetical protein